jgi:hypothetical protein
MIVLNKYDVMKLKDILEDVVYDISQLKEEGGEFLGLHIVIDNDKLYFIFHCDLDEFYVEPWFLYIDDKYKYKQGFLEAYFICELIDFFKNNDLKDVKVVIDPELTHFTVVKGEDIIFNYTIW